VDKKFNIKDQLAGIAALIAAIVAIGGGFVKYGEVMTKLDVLTKASKTVDLSIVAVLEEKIKKLENKKDIVVDLSSVESDISSITEELNQNKIKALVNSKEIELLKVQIEEIKESASNPLTN